jgi:putative transposase
MISAKIRAVDLTLAGAALMYNNSMLSEILKLLPRETIKKIVDSHKGDHYTKTFKSWDHLVAMITGQLAGVTSLRELEVTLNSHPECHYHLHTKNVKRSTLSDANNNRDFALFRDIATTLISRACEQKKKLQRVVTILDSSLILLKSRGHEWAKSTTTRSSNAGLKFHIQYNHTEDHVEYVEVGDGNINDITVAQKLSLESHRIYVFDKGYCDYKWWRAVADQGSVFVTRLKKNAAYRVIKSYEIAEEDKGFILKHQVIVLSSRHWESKRKGSSVEIPLQLIEIRHPSGKEEPFMIVTNDLNASAQRIAGWYKERWAIELLFKWLKQNLKIKRFMGESRNAIMIQIFVALISYVLLKLYKNLMQGPLRLKDVCTLVKMNLFTRPKLHHRKREKRRLSLESSQQLSFGFYSW